MLTREVMEASLGHEILLPTLLDHHVDQQLQYHLLTYFVNIDSNDCLTCMVFTYLPWGTSFV